MRSRPKRKMTKVVTANSAIAGSDCRVRSSERRSLARIAAKAVREGVTTTAAASPIPRRSTWSASGRNALGVVGDEDPGAARRRGRSARGPARGPRRRGWSRARRAAAAPARAGRSGRSASRWRIPAESSATRSSARRSIPTAASSSAIRASAGRALDPVQRGVEAQVLAPAQVAVEQRLVAEVADPAAQLPGLAAAASSPSTRTSPPLGRSSVARMRSSVVLPAPLGPSTTSDSPARQLEADPVERRPFAVVAAQRRDRERRLAPVCPCLAPLGGL